MLRHSAAEKAGFAAGDEWLGLKADTDKARTPHGWRLSKLDDIPLYLGTAKNFQALVARDQRLLTLQVSLPDAVKQIKLSARETARIDVWLGSAKHQKI